MHGFKQNNKTPLHHFLSYFPCLSGVFFRIGSVSLENLNFPYWDSVPGKTPIPDHVVCSPPFSFSQIPLTWADTLQKDYHFSSCGSYPRSLLSLSALCFFYVLITFFLLPDKLQSFKFQPSAEKLEKTCFLLFR